MIKDFETYIAEGRMGRLIDAAREEELRQEDVLRIKTYDDLLDYCSKAYYTTTGDSFFITQTNTGLIQLDLTKHETAVLYTDNNSANLSFKYVGFSSYEFMKKYPYTWSETIDESLDVIGIDRKIYKASNYDFGNVGFNFLEISRRDGKNMEPLEALTEIYDKIVSDEDNKNCIVRKNDKEL